MAKVKKLFYGSDISKTDDATIEVFNNTNNDIFIEIQMNEDIAGFIALDLETAQEFLKELAESIENIKLNLK